MEFTITLPDWAIEENKRLPSHIPSLEERMRHVIRFSRLNFENGTGGPFAAGVFERDTGKLVVIGVNRVVPSNCSSAHAEVTTLSVAQKLLGPARFGDADEADALQVLLVCDGGKHYITFAVGPFRALNQIDVRSREGLNLAVARP